MSYERFRERWAELTEGQKAWVRGKANWEHISLWSVMNNYCENEDPQV